MAMRSLGYMPSEVELAIIMQRLDMDGKTGAHSILTPPPLSPGMSQDSSEILGLKGLLKESKDLESKNLDLCPGLHFRQLGNLNQVWVFQTTLRRPPGVCRGGSGATRGSWAGGGGGLAGGAVRMILFHFQNSFVETASTHPKIHLCNLCNSVALRVSQVCTTNSIINFITFSSP